jgi:uncharacterized repeat protein (TIGR01451 family)
MNRNFVSRGIAATLLVAAAGLPAHADTTLFSQSIATDGVPMGGPYVPAGTLYDNEQGNNTTSLASQDSSGTLTARSADDFTIDDGACASGIFDITQIRIQMVQQNAAPQAFGVDLFDDDGTGTAPTPANAIVPIATFSETSQTLFGPFGGTTSIFEASFDTPGLTLNNGQIYWISGFGADAALNAATFNNFFAVSNGAGATLDNGVIIAPGAGVATWTATDMVVPPPRHAYSFAIDGVCQIAEADLDISKVGIVNPDETVTYSITVTNQGPADATGVTVTDAFPVELSYLSDTCGGDFTDGQWDIGGLANGAMATCDVTFDVLEDGEVINTAFVSGNEPDPTAANDSATSTLIVDGGPSVIEIPTLGGVGLAALLLLLGASAFVLLRRRSA